MTVSEMIFHNEKLYLLIQYNLRNSKGGSTRGALVRMNPETLTFSEDDVLGVPVLKTTSGKYKVYEQVTNWYISAEPKLPLEITDGTTSVSQLENSAETSLIGPEKFVGIQGDSLIFTDRGWFYQNKSYVRYRSSLITLDTATFTLKRNNQDYDLPLDFYTSDYFTGKTLYVGTDGNWRDFKFKNMRGRIQFLPID